LGGGPVLGRVAEGAGVSQAQSAKLWFKDRIGAIGIMIRSGGSGYWTLGLSA